MSWSRRGFLSVALAGAATGLAAGCAQKDNAPGGGSDSVKVWDRAGAEASARKEFLSSWNDSSASGAGFSIDYEPQATDKYDEIVRTAFQTKNAPDVLHTPTKFIPAFAQAGWIQPLDDLADQSVLDDVKDVVTDKTDFVSGGKIYAIPSVSFTIRLYYNKALFEKAGLDPGAPPTTIAEMTEMAKKISSQGKGDYYGLAAPVKWAGFLGWCLQPMVQGAYDDAADGMFLRSQGRFDTGTLSPAVKMYQDLIASKVAFPGSSTLSLDTGMAAFSEGKAAMVVMGTMGVSTLSAIGKIPEGAAVAALPVPEGKQLVWSPMNAGFPFAVTSTAADAKQSAATLNLIVGADIQAALAKKDIPPLSAAAWDSVDKATLLKQMQPGTLDRQLPSSPTSLIPLQGPTAQQVVERLVLDPKADVEAGLTDLSDRQQAAYEKGVSSGDIDPADYTA